MSIIVGLSISFFCWIGLGVGAFGFFYHQGNRLKMGYWLLAGTLITLTAGAAGIASFIDWQRLTVLYHTAPIWSVWPGWLSFPGAVLVVGLVILIALILGTLFIRGNRMIGQRDYRLEWRR